MISYPFAYPSPLGTVYAIANIMLKGAAICFFACLCYVTLLRI